MGGAAALLRRLPAESVSELTGMKREDSMANSSLINEDAIARIRTWIEATKQELDARGIAGFEACYSGEGDSGAFDYVDWIYREDIPFKKQNYAPPPVFAGLVDDLLPGNGFEINDGGGGTILCEITGEIRHTSYYYIQTDGESEEL
jgi:hypothetical protein